MLWSDEGKIPEINDTLEKLGKALRCSICLETWDNPRFTACMHYFCRQCINDHISKSNNKKKNFCPVCRTQISKRELKEPSWANAALTEIRSLAACLQRDTNCAIPSPFIVPPSGNKSKIQEIQEEDHQKQKRRLTPTLTQKQKRKEETVQKKNSTDNHPRETEVQRTLHWSESPITVENDEVEAKEEEEEPVRRTSSRRSKATTGSGLSLKSKSKSRSKTKTKLKPITNPKIKTKPQSPPPPPDVKTTPTTITTTITTTNNNNCNTTTTTNDDDDDDEAKSTATTKKAAFVQLSEGFSDVELTEEAEERKRLEKEEEDEQQQSETPSIIVGEETQAFALDSSRRSKATTGRRLSLKSKSKSRSKIKIKIKPITDPNNDDPMDMDVDDVQPRRLRSSPRNNQPQQQQHSPTQRRTSPRTKVKPPISSLQQTQPTQSLNVTVDLDDDNDDDDDDDADDDEDEIVRSTQAPKRKRRQIKDDSSDEDEIVRSTQAPKQKRRQIKDDSSDEDEDYDSSIPDIDLYLTDDEADETDDDDDDDQKDATAPRSVCLDGITDLTFKPNVFCLDGIIYNNTPQDITGQPNTPPKLTHLLPNKLSEFFSAVHQEPPPLDLPPSHRAMQTGRETSVQISTAAASIAHLKGPPWNCEHCKYSSSRKSSLITHIRTHTGEKPYACDQCSYRCAQSSALITHKRTHTGEKRYACDQCSHRSARSSNLTRHKQTHHNQK